MANNNHFNLTLDTIAPTGSITMPADYTKGSYPIIGGNKNMTITHSDGAVYMKVWHNGKGNTGVGKKTDTGYTSGTWDPVVNTKMSDITIESGCDGQYNYHLVLRDALGNESPVYDTGEFGLDNSAPVISTNVLNGGISIANHRDLSLVITTLDYPIVEDPQTLFEVEAEWATGPAYALIQLNDGTPYRVDGPFIPHYPSEQEPQYAPDYYTLTTTVIFPTDGASRVTVTIVDGVGHSSTSSESNTVTIDTQGASAILSLHTSDQQSALPQYVSTRGFSAKIIVQVPQGESAKVNGYKIWGYDGQQSEPTSYTTVTTGTIEIWKTNLNCTTGDGTKTIQAKVKDIYGNETSLTSCSFVYDNTVPTITYTSILSDYENTEIYYNKSTRTSFTITSVSVTDATSGIDWINNPAKWQYHLEGASDWSDGGNLSEGVNNVLIPNSKLTIVNEVYSIRIIATDRAGKTSTVVLGGFVRDSLPPSVSIGAFNPWYKQVFNISVTGTDPTDNCSGMKQYECWVDDDNSQTTTVPAGTPVVPWTGTTQTITSANINWTSLRQGQNYMHVVSSDNVGNKVCTNKTFNYDSVPPTLPTTSIKPYVNQRDISMTISSTDSTSGVSQYYLSGAGVVNQTGYPKDTWTALPQDNIIPVYLSTGDGVKAITIKVRDLAQNESDVATTSTTLDTQAPGPHIVLRTLDDSSAKSTPTSEPKFSVQVNDSDVDITGYKFQLYGDFTEGTTQSASGTAYISDPTSEAWKDLVYDRPISGTKTYKWVGNLICTSNTSPARGETKNINVAIMDRAGNPAHATASFYYDVITPVATVSNVDYNNISKIHQVRGSETGQGTTGTYYDKMTFQFSANEDIIAYKVCAYLTQAQATNVTNIEAETPIPTTGGSIHTSASGTTILSGVVTTTTIMGVDYETALVARGGTAGGTCEGLHYVVVYVKDFGGTWSALADFTGE